MPGSASRYPFSVIRERLRTHEGRALDFAIGSASPRLSESLARLIREQPELALKRADRARLDAFAEAASTMLFRVYGIEVEPADVLPAPAGRLAMSALAAVVLRPGDAVLVTEPGYPAFARVAVHHHATLHRVPLHPGRGFAPVLDGVADQAIRLAALNYPNNPTGTMIPSATIEELGRGLEPDAVIFNDAVYGPLTHGVPPRSLLGVAAELSVRQPVLELHSLAKLFALGPQGLAFLVGSKSQIEPLREFSEFLWAVPSALQVELGVCALQDEAHLTHIRRSFGQRLEKLRNVLEEGGFVPYPTPAGLYVLCELPERVAGEPVRSAQQAADRLLEQSGLVVVGWDAPPHSYLRFSVMYREEDLDALSELLRSRRLVS